MYAVSSFHKKKDLGADAEISNLNTLFFGLLKVRHQGTNLDSRIPAEMVVHNSSGTGPFVSYVLHVDCTDIVNQSKTNNFVLTAATEGPLSPKHHLIQEGLN